MRVDPELARYILVLVTAPFWWPFLRELYREMNSALREDGGLLGRPTAKDTARFEEYRSPLVSTPFRDPVHRNRGAQQAAPRAASAPSGGKPRPAAGAAARTGATGSGGFARKRGFRDR